MNERRMFARINRKIPLKFLNPTNGKEGAAETVDISANGVGFVTKESLLPETPLEMWLDIPYDGKPIHLLGKVVWAQDLGDNISRRVGVHLGEGRLVSLGHVWSFKKDNPDII